MRQGYYLRQRKNGGSFHIVFVDPITGKQTHRTTETNDEKKANAIAQGWLLNGLPDKPKANNIAKQTAFCDYLHQFWDFETSEYFREVETMGKEPHVEHALEMQKAVKRYYRPYFGNKLLCQIDEEYLQKFVVYLKTEKKLAASTVNSARNAAFVALRYAKRKKIIRQFDFDAVLRAGGKAKERGILERDEVEKLFSLEWPSARSRMAVLIAANTGMRMGEVRALRVYDIHEDRISVCHSWGKKSRMKSTKNQEIREVPIIQAFYEEIMAYIKESGFYKLDCLLLPGKNPEIPYNNRQIGKDFNKMLEEIGIDEKERKERGIVYHSWRHLLAKNLVQKGVPKAIGMKILGQKTGRVFDKYADHVDKETFRQMTNAIETVSNIEALKEPIPFHRVV
ncbi:MAG: site-specific integrase [Treponema sp.]|jgi:integrase|nr:site-specific integrase [Treponema sp.]